VDQGCIFAWTTTVTPTPTPRPTSTRPSTSEEISTPPSASPTTTPSPSPSETETIAPPWRPTSNPPTSTSPSPPQSPTNIPGCPTGFYACSAVYHGGCCRTGRDCNPTSCPAIPSTTVVNSNGVTVVPMMWAEGVVPGDLFVERLIVRSRAGMRRWERHHRAMVFPEVGW
jgi:hypothetical protein